MTTNEYSRGVRTKKWGAFDGKLWQRNYYEHIIRDEPSHMTIAEYISNNPVRWERDELYGERE
jgi:REP element-mobilizing transposase RayT